MMSSRSLSVIGSLALYSKASKPRLLITKLEKNRKERIPSLKDAYVLIILDMKFLHAYVLQIIDLLYIVRMNPFPQSVEGQISNKKTNNRASCLLHPDLKSLHPQDVAPESLERCGHGQGDLGGVEVVVHHGLAATHLRYRVD